MAFVLIIDAAVRLSGREAKYSGEYLWNDLEADECVQSLALELVLGAEIGMIGAIPVHDKIDKFATVDMDDARSFLVRRGLLDPKPAVFRGRRDNQLELLQSKALDLGIDLKHPAIGDKAKLRDALRSDHPLFFTNFEDIWKDAKRKGIASPINLRRHPTRRD